MSDIRRSITTVDSDITITDPDKGVVLTDNVGDQDRITVIDDDGVKSIRVEEVP